MTAPRYCGGPVGAGDLWTLGRLLHGQDVDGCRVWLAEHVRGRASALQTIEVAAALYGRTARRIERRLGARPGQIVWAFTTEGAAAEPGAPAQHVGQVLIASANGDDIEGFLIGLEEWPVEHVMEVARAVVSYTGLMLHYLQEHDGRPCDA